MAKSILCIIADPDTRIDSYSSSVTKAFLDELRSSCAECKVTELNLYDTDLPALHLSLIKNLSASADGTDRSLKGEEIPAFTELIDQIGRSDALIFISRTIAFGLPARLKGFIEVLAVTKNIETLQHKKGIHLHIEDDTLTPFFATREQDIFRDYLMEWSVTMMETLTLSHHLEKTSGQESGLLEMIRDTRESAQEFSRFIG